MRVYLDANIFIHAAGKEHPLKAPCLAVLAQVATGDLEASTSVEVLQEIAHVYRRRGHGEAGVKLVREIMELI